MEKAQEKKPATAKKAVKIVLNVVAWIVVVVAVLMTALVFTSQSSDGISNLLGVMPMTIQSDSMNPTFHSGDLIIGRQTDADNLQEGDIITFWTIIENKKAVNTHRIIEVKQENGIKTYVTQGDNNTAADALSVYPADVIAKYTGTRLPGVGRVLDFLKTSTGFLVCVVVPLIIFFLYEVYRFISVIISMKKPKLTAEQEREMKQKIIDEYIASQNDTNE